MTSHTSSSFFCQCVDWSDASEARQAAELMQQWAPIDVADALELLSPDFVNEEVGVTSHKPPSCWQLFTSKHVLNRSIPISACLALPLSHFLFVLWRFLFL